MTVNLPEFMTVAEAAQALRCCRQSIHNFMSARKLTFTKVGRVVRIPRKAVEEFVARATVQADVEMV